MTHQAWDDGAILDGMAEVLGEGIRSICTQKTTKTKCLKRVPMDQINNDAATCPACILLLQIEAEGRLILRGYENAFKEFGFEFANKLTRDELLAAAKGL